MGYLDLDLNWSKVNNGKSSTSTGYNANKQKIQEVKTNNGHQTSCTKYTYDSYGRVIKEEKTIGAGRGGKEITEYEYRSNGDTKITITKYAPGQSPVCTCQIIPAANSGTGTNQSTNNSSANTSTNTSAANNPSTKNETKTEEVKNKNTDDSKDTDDKQKEIDNLLEGLKKYLNILDLDDPSNAEEAEEIKKIIKDTIIKIKSNNESGVLTDDEIADIAEKYVKKYASGISAEELKTKIQNIINKVLEEIEKESLEKESTEEAKDVTEKITEEITEEAGKETVEMVAEEPVEEIAPEEVSEPVEDEIELSAGETSDLTGVPAEEEIAPEEVSEPVEDEVELAEENNNALANTEINEVIEEIIEKTPFDTIA